MDVSVQSNEFKLASSALPSDHYAAAFAGDPTLRHLTVPLDYVMEKIKRLNQEVSTVGFAVLRVLNAS